MENALTTDSEAKYREAIEADPDNAYNYLDLGVDIQGKGKDGYPEAIEEYKKAEALFANQGSIDRKYPLFNWANILRWQGRLIEAEAKYREAIDVDPEYPDTLFGLGIALQEQGKDRYPEAIEVYKRAEELYGSESPIERRSLLSNWADILRKQEQLSEAEAKYREIIKLNPDYADAYNSFGLTLKDQGKDRYSESIEAYKKAEALYAIEGSIARKYPLANWADILTELDQFSEAEAKYREAITVDPEYAHAYNSLGLALKDQGKDHYPDAIETYKKAETLYASEGSIARKYPLVNWADILSELDQFSEAEAKYREAITVDPEYAYAYSCLGLVLKNQGKDRYPDAIEAYNNAEALYASNSSIDRKYPLANWASILSEQGQFSEAEAKFYESIKVDADFAHAYNGLGLALNGQGTDRYAEAIEAYKKAATLYTGDDLINRKYPLRNLGWILSELEDYDGAVENFHLSLEADREDASSYYSLGTGLAFASQYEDAIAEFDKAIYRNARDPYPKHNKAHYLFYMGRYEKGWKAWNEAVETYKTCLGDNLSKQDDIDYALYFAGVLEELYNEREEAEKWYCAVLKIDPDKPEAFIGLAGLYSRWLNSSNPSPASQSRISSVITKGAKVLKARLGKYNAWDSTMDLANFYLEAEDFNSAKEWLLLARDSCGELRGRCKIVANRLGTLYAKLERYDKAVDQFQAALRISPEDLKLRANLAGAYLKLEQFDRAESEFRRVMRMAPGNIESLIGLAQLCIELADTGDIDRYSEAEKYLSTAIKHGVHKMSGSKRLVGKELAQVYYLRGYVRVKYYEANSVKPLLLSNAMMDFKKCIQLDGKGEFNFKANSALKKIHTYTKERRREGVFEWIGPLMVCLLATFVFVFAQLDFFFGVAELFGFKTTDSNRLIKPIYYITVTFGSLMFVIAGLYLPKVLKLKVGTIELEKSTVSQISTSASLGISR